MSSYKFFSNKDCEFFPCHKNINKNTFNCLFCFCPLYNIDCKSLNVKFIQKGDRMIKDCSDCTNPHYPYEYDHIIDILNKNG
jgi:Zn-finger protein